MSQSVSSAYSHTQKAPWCFLLYGLSVLLLGSAWLTREQPMPAIILAVVGVLMGVLAPSFHHLTVQDEGDQLVVRFGPISLFRTSILYRDMESIQTGRTLFLDGWGIHGSLRGGWVWNLWGRDCVVVQRRHKSPLRIGTDEAEKLAAFLKTKTGP